jgi:iduronate 2-sulfatase
LIISTPEMKVRGTMASGLVELIDLFPTVCDLTRVPPLAKLQGKSLRPLLENSQATIHHAAFTQARRGANAELWGRSVRTERWRCTEWDEGRNGIELYDHHADPHEYTNLATDPKHAGTLEELRALLASTLPPIAVKP